MNGDATAINHKQQVEFLLKIGPQAALRSPIKQTLNSWKKSKPVAYASALLKSVPSTTALLEALGQLYCHGCILNFSKINQFQTIDEKPLEALVNLPEYPFDHSRSYWRESRISRGFRLRKMAPNQLLGIQVPDWNSSEARWRLKIKLSEDPWLQDHKVCERIIFPA